MGRPYQPELHHATECVKITLVLRNDYEGQVCSIASALELVGERWTLLVIREVFNGHRRFGQIQESLGVA
ncbi:MAG: winged helix-turn-helix transcriptional regulator, partial [Solirubrobacterales bacterium]